MIRVNGQWTENIHALDRGVMYGDGVFRTMLVRGGRPLRWRRHLLKLQTDCAALGIACPAEAILTDDVTELAEIEPDCVLKIVVTRGVGRRGYAVSADAAPTRILVTSPIPSYPGHYYSTGVKVHLCSLRLANQPRLAGIKHLNRLENVLARREWNDPEISEGLLLDVAGNVIEGTMTNLFMVRESALWTPDLSQCGVAGVQRERIIEAAEKLGMSVRIESLPLTQLLEADEVLLCNSVLGIWQVKELAGKAWGLGTRVGMLRQCLQDDSNN